MSASNLVSSSSNSSLSSGSFSRLDEVSEILDRLIEKINTVIQCNFCLRHALFEDLSSEERLISWMNHPDKKFQNLDQNVRRHFAVPQAVDHLFGQLRAKIYEGNHSVSGQAAYYRSCAALIKGEAERMRPVLKDYSWLEIGLAIRLSEDFKRVIDLLLWQPTLQYLDSDILKQKMLEFFRRIRDVEDMVTIARTLESTFTFNEESARELANEVQKADPFNRSLVKKMLNSPSDLQGRSLSFVECDQVRTVKVKEVKSEEVSQAVIKVTLTDEKQSVIIIVDRSRNQLTEIIWQVNKEQNLRSFLNAFGPSNAATCHVEDPFEWGAQWSKWLPAGEYHVEVFSRGRRESDQSERSEVSSASGDIFSRTMGEGIRDALDTFTTFPLGERRISKEFWFTPTASSSERPAEPISLGLFEDRQSGEMHFIVRKEGESEEYAVRFDIFCQAFPLRVKETLRREIRFTEQNRVYLSEIDASTNEEFTEQIRRRSVADKAVSDLLKEVDLDPVFSVLLERWLSGGDLLQKEGRLLSLIREVFDNPKLQEQIFTLCEIDEIAPQSREKDALLLDYIFRANLDKLAPDHSLLQHSDLIKMLGHSLALSEDLKGKRGIAIFGETRSGKTTTTCFLLGLRLEAYPNQFGRTEVKVVETAPTDLSRVPEIGFALGISKTTFAEGFSLIRLEEESNIQAGRMEEDLTKRVTFPRGVVDPEQFLVIDFPGFKDTRGTEYEVVTNFSIDQTVQRLSALDAIIQIIPDYFLRAPGGAPFIDALRELSARFRGSFEDKTLRPRIFFLITKQDNKTTVNTLRKLAETLLDEEKRKPFPDEEKQKLLSFFIEQCQTGRVFPVLPTFRSQRIEILNKILENAQKPDETGLKGCYRFLDSPDLKLKFADILNNSIGVWVSLVFPQFFDLKQRIEDAQREIRRMQEEQSSFQGEIGRIQERILFLDQENASYRQDIETLRANPEVSPEQLRKITDTQRRRYDGLQMEIRRLRENGEVLRNRRNADSQKKLSKVERKNTVDEEILSRIRDIDEKTTGSSPGPEPYEDDFNQSIGPIVTDELPLDTIRRLRIDAVERGTDRLNYREGEYRKRTYNRDQSFTMYKIANVLKDYQLLPPGQDEMNQTVLNRLIAGETNLSLDRGKYRVEVQMNKIYFDYIRHHDNGKHISYGYVLNFDGRAPYPYLKIIQVIPNEELNRSEVNTLRTQKATLESEGSRLLEEIQALEGRIESASRDLRDNSDALAREEDSFRSHRDGEILSRIDGELRDNEREKERLDSAIPNKRSEIERLETSIVETSAKLGRLVFEGKRWGLVIRTHASHLENAIKMAQFFKALALEPTGIPAIDEKQSNIRQECETFLRDYENLKDRLETELNALGLFASSVKITVYTKGLGDSDELFLRGDKAGLEGWSKAVRLRKVAPNHFETEIGYVENCEYKVRLNDDQWENGNNHIIRGKDSQVIYPIFEGRLAS